MKNNSKTKLSGMKFSPYNHLRLGRTLIEASCAYGNEHTFGILTLDQKSSRCSFILDGLYLEYNMASSVNIPMWARSRPKAASSNWMSSSKNPRSCKKSYDLFIFKKRWLHLVLILGAVGDVYMTKLYEEIPITATILKIKWLSCTGGDHA